MFRRLIQKKMVGGLVFGPPGWMPERIEETFDAPAGAGAGVAVQGGATKENAAPTMRGELIGLLERAGLGRTSNVIPALVEQLYELKSRRVRTLVLDALPTQPEFVLGSALSRLALEDLMQGMEAIVRVVGPRRIVVALDRHDLTSYRMWLRAIRARKVAGPQIRIKMLLNRYPQADPTILSRTLFGQRLPAGALPTRVGRLIVDPVTCWGLGRYLRMGQALMDRPVQLITQEGHAPRLVMGRIGETVAAFCGRYGEDASGRQVIVNGMLTGQEVDAGTACIGATTEAVSLREAAENERPTACLACGWCVDVCPTALTPVHLMQLAQSKPGGAGSKAALAQSAGAREALHCIACGLCSYVCPTRLPLMEETLRLRACVEGATRDEKTKGAA